MTFETLTGVSATPNSADMMIPKSPPWDGGDGATRLWGEEGGVEMEPPVHGRWGIGGGGDGAAQVKGERGGAHPPGVKEDEVGWGG